MEIGAAGFSGVSQQQYAPQSIRSEFAEQVRSADQAARSDQAVAANEEASRVQAQRQESNEQSERAAAANVYVNAQGQKTGTIISVTA